jgi:hypothetical protein
MTITDFLATLTGRADAIEQINGALMFADGMAPEDRAALVRARLEFQKGKRR